MMGHAKATVAALLAVFLASCATTSHWKQVRETAPRQLSSAEVRQVFRNASFFVDVEGSSAQEVRSDSSMNFTLVGTNTVLAFQLLDNGLLCSRDADRRFCYRVFVGGERFVLTYADGTIYQSGRLSTAFDPTA